MFNVKKELYFLFKYHEYIIIIHFAIDSNFRGTVSMKNVFIYIFNIYENYTEYLYFNIFEILSVHLIRKNFETELRDYSELEG